MNILVSVFPLAVTDVLIVKMASYNTLMDYLLINSLIPAESI